jgi:hypothetical protein
MIRHASGRKKPLCDVTRLLDIGRRSMHGAVDRAKTMVPWLKTHFIWHNLPWLLCARFQGESWVHCFASTAGLVPIERLTNNENLQVLVVWFDASENRTHARLHKKGSLVAELAAAGTGDVPFEVISFKSSVHPKTFLKRCKTVRQAVDGFCAAVDARLRDLVALKAKGGLELQDLHGQAVGADELDELDVTCYAPVSSEENPASVRSKSAIDSAGG